MYFETGQGSEYTYGKHEGIDMTTTEALCYGLARRYDPFMVNNVTGFIGPETHLDNFEMIMANLQDHFMGKLLGLPMGMAPCYTLHSRTTLEGQQIATQLLTAAGANYYMDVFLNTDRMLAYFDTSGHDDQTLREVHGKSVAPEYLEWAIGQGIFKRGADGSVLRGPTWGNVRRFCESDAEYQELIQATPALYGFEHAGPRPANAVSRLVKANQAAARTAVYSDLDRARLTKIARFRVLETEAADRESHLSKPELGSRLSARSARRLRPENRAIQIVVSDGLSAEAVNHNLAELYPVLQTGFASTKTRCGQPILVPFGRVKLAEEIAHRLKAQLTLMLIGERPGGDALSSQSLSAYFIYRLGDKKSRVAAANFSGNPAIKFEYSVLSNIYSGGLPPAEAASLIVERSLAILSRRAAGNRFEALAGGK
jgi:ethanolamine ammonia-lyase large subunit